MCKTFLYLYSINWAQSLLDGIIQFIATVLLAFIISNNYQKKINKRELSAVLHDELVDYLFELFDHLDDLAARTRYLQKQSTESLENNAEIFIEYSELLKFQSIREQVGIISIKIKSITSILGREKLIDPELINILNELVHLTKKFGNLYCYNWLPNKSENPSYFFKHFNSNQEQDSFDDQIIDVLFNHNEFFQSFNLELIFEKLVMSKFRYGTSSSFKKSR